MPKGRGFTPPLITPHCWEGLNMFKINTMMEPNVCLLLFAAAVTLFLLPGALMDRTRGRAFMKCFIALCKFRDMKSTCTEFPVHLHG